MKKLMLLTTIFALAYTSIATAGELQNGFMNYQWGENISQYRTLMELSTRKDIIYCSDPTVSYTIDDISINNVILGFYKDAFFAVYIGIDTPEAYNRIRYHMKQKYGLPDTKLITGFPNRHASERDRQTILKWKYKDVIIKLKTDQITGKMKLAFYYGPISNKLKTDHFDDIDETSLRFFPIDKNERPRMIPFLEF
ncbi:hypothetical protein DGMP_04030 [Desulfomarina profundi]|uniref:Uncharacterized protein n=1 Tax=Desulfomarina profundi TaxID=2772557 RepID=A0A8D5FFQ5_9BACT|nr:hypothetical protein [Desulfomarina profundi]BCL59710.1 hypothetical protein DGMP_04030 [Desulfomarina profundi]